MKLKHYLMAAALLATFGTTAVSCSDDNDNATEQGGNNPGGNNNSGESTGEYDMEAQGDVEGIWTSGKRIHVTGHITVPEGKSLTIEEGVQLIFSTEGVGANHVAIEFIVKGNLYCKGTAENPILMSVPEDQRLAGNIFKEEHQWGGIVAYPSCEEMLIDHTTIEYTGGQVIEGSPAASAGIYEAGDDAYPQITTNNPSGRYVITNSTIRYGWSDGIYMMGGNGIIAHNIFAGNGYDGAESVNVKAGCKVDVAGNIMYAPNTNGLKLSSDGQDDVTRAQGKIKAYNNTIFNAGWRRDGEKGGCIYAEKNVLADVFNNMMVNCKYRAQTPSWKDPNNIEEGYDTKSVIDYNCYISGRQQSDVIWGGEMNDEGEWEAGSGIAYAWEGYNYDHKNYHTEPYTTTNGILVPAVDAHSIIATKDNLPDPAFVNYDIHTAKMSDVVYDNTWDFHTTNVIAGAYSGSEAFAQPYFQTSGLTVGDATYYSPAVKACFGAYGAN